MAVFQKTLKQHKTSVMRGYTIMGYSVIFNQQHTFGFVQEWGHPINGYFAVRKLQLVGGFKHFLFSKKKGCHPKPIDELHHFSRWAHCTTNQMMDVIGTT